MTLQSSARGPEPLARARAPRETLVDAAVMTCRSVPAWERKQSWARSRLTGQEILMNDTTHLTIAAEAA